jgi:hypothetical protein
MSIDSELFNRNFKGGKFCKSMVMFYLQSVFENKYFVELRKFLNLKVTT